MKIKKDRFSLFCLFSIIFFQVNFAAEIAVDNQISAKTDNIKRQVSTEINYGKIPLYFIPNKGQVSSEAMFYAKTHNYTLWMTGKGLVFDRLWEVSNEKVITNPESGTREDYKQSTRAEAHRSSIDGKMSETSEEHGKFARDVSRLQFIGANEKTEIIAGEHTGNKVNFFIGNDQSKWSDNIETSKSVVYKDIYNGIDLMVYGTESQIEYDWIVRPGASPASIVFRYENVESSEIDSTGDLVVHSSSGDLVHKKPLSYQVIDGKRIDVDVDFKQFADGSYGFNVSPYHADYVLVIDPLIAAYSTHLGGSNFDDASGGIAVDSTGAAYIAGHSLSANFPIVNQYQGYQGGIDLVVTKLSPSGNTILYSTYIGGSSNDNCEGIAIDSNGAAYVTGYTDSTDFPLVNQYQGDQPNMDAYVLKLSPSGNALSYSTYLGGNDIDRGRSIAVDSSGSAYVTGETISADFPLVNQYQGSMGDYDAFVTKLSPSGNSLLYSTHLGGSFLELAWGIAVDSSGAAYVTGVTRSTDFPLENEYQGTLNLVDAFVTKFSPSGNALVFSTYLGGSSYDGGLGIATDSSNAVYVAGYTSSADFPLVNEYQGFQGSMDSFVAKFSPSGSILLYSTCVGGTSQEAPTGGIAVDSSGAAYVVGWTTSSDLPLVNQYQRYNGDIDAFLFKLSPQGDLQNSTYIGGSLRDDGCGIAVDSSGASYIAGFTFSSDFPLVNQYQGNMGNFDAFIIKLIWQNPIAAPVAVINADRFGGIAPVMINFNGTSSYDKNGTIIDWRWSFGDGSSSTDEITSHEYTIPGEFTVTLQVRDNDGIWSPIKGEKILILENRESLTCNMTVNPVMFKAYGRETGTVSTALSVNGNVIFTDMGLTFSASSGAMMGDKQFDKNSGVLAETLSSGSPGSFSVYTMLDGQSVCQTTVQYTWPLAPSNLQVTVWEDRGLLEGVLYASLTWTDNPEDIYPTAGFNVYKSITGGAWTLITSLPANARSYTIESLPSREQIRVGVSKIDTEGDESEMIIQTIQSN